MVKEAIEEHDKSIKDAIDKTLNTFKAMFSHIKL